MRNLQARVGMRHKVCQDMNDSKSQSLLMPIDLEELVDLFYSLSLTRTLPDDLFKVLWGWEKG